MESLHIVVKFYEKDLGSGSVEKNVSSVEFYVGNQDSATIYRASPEMIEFLQPAIKMLQAKREEVVNSFAGSRGIKRGVYQGSFFLDRGRIDSDFHDHREEAHLVSNIQLGTSRGTEFSDGYVTHRNKWVHFGPYERHRAAPQVVEDGGWRWVAVVFHLK